MSGLLMGLIGGGVSGLATSLGALPILLKNKRITNLLKNINMDFVTGVMLSAAAFALIWPAYATVLERNNQLDFVWVSLALALGVLFISSVGKLIEYLLRDKEHVKENKKAMLFVIAMMVHNFPEGLASGASMAMPQSAQGVSLLSAIAIQNIPEGLTTALSFVTLGLTPVIAFFGAVSTGAVELIGGLLGGYLSHQVDGILPVLMAFAGGAMMSVTIVEVVERMKAERLRFLMGPSFLSGILLMILFNNL